MAALQDVSLNVPEGNFFAIMGPSGSGKSTLMNILGCLDRPTSGEYILNGTDVSTIGEGGLAELRNKLIGFVFQSFCLIPKLTALENIEVPMAYAGVPPAERRKRALHLLRKLGMEHRANHLPAELSGGQCQRIAIARAIANRPRLILADEPTGNLDIKTGEDIMSILQELHRDGATVVLITHEPDIAGYAGDTLRLSGGRLYYGGCA